MYTIPDTTIYPLSTIAQLSNWVSGNRVLTRIQCYLIWNKSPGKFWCINRCLKLLITPQKRPRYKACLWMPLPEAVLNLIERILTNECSIFINFSNSFTTVLLSTGIRLTRSIWFVVTSSSASSNLFQYMSSIQHAPRKYFPVVSKRLCWWRKIYTL